MFYFDIQVIKRNGSVSNFRQYTYELVLNYNKIKKPEKLVLRLVVAGT